MKFDDKSAKNVSQSTLLNDAQKAQISDLVDGQLPFDAFSDVMALLDNDSQARSYWYGLHVAGDILRGEAHSNVANTAKDLAFLDSFRAHLAKESPLKSATQVNDLQTTLARVGLPAAKAANDSFFSWKWVGGISAAAAVIAFSWNLVSITATSPNGAAAQLAQSAAQATPVVTQTAAGAMLRNPQLDALIAAHNQAGGSSALQMPSGFLRSATFTTDVPVTGLSDK
jgi:sigma-E factor negative regulatory protein RseA